MKSNRQNLEQFSNSDSNSPQENTFMEDTINQYHDEKRRREYAEILENKHNILRDAGAGTKAKKNNVTRFLILAGFVIAALTAAFFFSKENNDSRVNYQVASTLDPYYTEIDFSTRGVIADANVLAEIGKSYENKDFANVSSLYNSLESLDIEGKYLHAIAVSLMNNGQLDEAIKVWNVLLATEESKFTYHNDARWFSGRAMVESGTKVEQGKKILSEVKAESEHYDDAQKLMNAK